MIVADGGWREDRHDRTNDSRYARNRTLLVALAFRSHSGRFVVQREFTFDRHALAMDGGLNL